ncbi:MAG TPA: PilZ domain-containing protein [Pseudolabrys sp.]|jgi:hypothetical protein|nr:PilZ domain-containing protein [Pseudolabrys sp.]
MSGSDKRRWFRSTPKGLVPRSARLLLGPNKPPIECKVVDLSAGGAQLEFQRTYDLPPRFEILHGATKRWCTIAWSRGYRIGISYEGSNVQRSSVSGGLSRPKGGASLLSRR